MLNNARIDLVASVVRLFAPREAPSWVPSRLLRGDVRAWRRWMSLTEVSPVPSSVTSWEVPDAGGTFFLAPGADPARRLLFVHGGAFLAGSVRSHAAFAAVLSNALGMAVLSVEYPLAPEHPFPAAVEHIDSSRRWLAENGPEGPGDARALFVAGDSAGGNLAAVQTLRAIRDGERVPDGVVLISPVMDLLHTGESWQSLKDVDPMLRPGITDRMTHYYVPDRQGDELRDPDISPLYAADDELAEFPPTILLVGGVERLLDDSRRFYRRLHLHGRDVELVIEPELFHDWPLFDPFLREARDGVDRIRRFAERVGGD